MANGAASSSTPLDGENFENATTIVAHDRPEVEVIEPTNSPLEEGEIEDVSEDDRPANSIQVIDGDDNIDEIIKEAYQDLPKVSNKVISTVAEASVQELESRRKGLLREPKRREEYARQRSSNKFQATSHGNQSRDTYRRTRHGADSRFDRSSKSTSMHDDQMARNYRQDFSNEAISGRYSRTSDRAANRDIDERYVLSPPPPPPLLAQMIPMPQATQQQNYNKPTKPPLLPTPTLLNIAMPSNPQSSYTSGANPIPPPQPRPSAQLYPTHQSLYGVVPYPLQHPMQSTSQVSPYEYFPHNLPPPTLKQPQLSRTDAQSSWSLDVENFLSQKPAVQSKDNYEEVGMDLASPVSAVNVEEEEVIDGQNDKRTKHSDEDDYIEELRKALLEQQKIKTSRRQVVLSRDCSPISSRERKDRSADKRSHKSRSSTSRQLKKLKEDLSDVRGSIDESEKKMKEYSHRYENLKKELQRTLNAIRTEQKSLQEHHERQMELTLKYEMMEINLKQIELTKKRRDKSLEQDCADELAVTNEIIRRCRNADEKLRTKENNLALFTATPQPSPPLEENGKGGLVPEEVDTTKTPRKRSKEEKEAPVKPKMSRNEPEVVAPKPMSTVITTISSPSAKTTLEENRANERLMLQLPQISTAKALKTALKTIVRKENQRSFPHKSAHLYAAANSYFPPTLPEPGYIANAELYKWTEVPTPPAYGIGLRIPPGTKQVQEQSINEPFVNGQSLEKVVTPVQQKTTIEHMQVVINEETEDRPFSRTSNEKNNSGAIELSPNSEQQNPEEFEHQMDQNEVLDEVARRQELLARIRKEKMIVESAPSAPLIGSVVIDKEWEPESPTYDMDDESGMENPVVEKPIQQEVNEPVSRNDDVAAFDDYRPQSPDYVPEGCVYKPMSPNYDIDYTENEVTSQPSNEVDERSESPRFENNSITQMQNGVEASANRGQVEPNATLEVPSTSVNTPNSFLNVNLPLCSSELLYGTCIEPYCRMQHLGNTASAHSEPEPPKEKPKKKVIVPRVYDGEDAMVAEFVRGVFAEMPKEYQVGYIEAGVTAMIKRWKAEKDRGNTFEKFKPAMVKLIDQITKKQQKDDPAQKELTAEKRAVLNKDPKLGVPDYVSRFSF